MMLMQPPLALGQAVHDVVEDLSVLPVEKRLKRSLLAEFESHWETVTGEKGGFGGSEEEEKYKERGRRMIQRIIDNPGPIAQKAVKIRQELPYYWFSEEDSLILCGKIDWLSYNESDDSIQILDFKTGKHDEIDTSLQLPIYILLVTNCQKRKLAGASYWYLEREAEPRPVELPDQEEAKKDILEIGKRIALARKLNRFACVRDGCSFCEPYERLLRGEGKLVGESSYHQDIFILV